MDITHRLTSAIIFSSQAHGLAAALADAVANNANLRDTDLSDTDLLGVDLSGANLSGANLSGANLRSADLLGADLRSADLGNANLRGADLCGADLRWANLRGANLRGADLCDATLRKGEVLVGLRPLIEVGPVGSRADTLRAYITDKGLRLATGCQQYITKEVFLSRLTHTHRENDHAQEYMAALALIDTHVKQWTPK